MAKQSTINNKAKKNLELLTALLSIGGKSDRAIAKILGISNTTLSNRKRRLEKEGYIEEYTIIPDFRKMGIELIQFSFSSTTDYLTQEQVEEARKLMQNHPEILCVLDSQDEAGTKWVAISVHKNYNDYLEHSLKMQKEVNSLLLHRPHIETRSVLIVTGKQYLKSFSLRNLKSVISQP